MADPQISDRLRELVDSYLDGTIATAELAELEGLLRADGAARGYFARYSQTNTDIALEVASRAAAERALARIPESPAVPGGPRVARTLTPRSARWVAAASLLLGMSIGGGAVGLLASPTRSGVPPAPVPRSLTLYFREPRPGSLADATGSGTGFTHRLPGTGTGLPAHDPNLRLLPAPGGLEATATRSDLNTRFRLDQAEFPGVRLADLGFTGAEDFEVAVTVADVPAMAFVGQFGVYVGASADWAVRGGLVSQRAPDSFRQFVVNTRDGRDKDAYFVGLGAPGDDLRIRIARTGGKFSMAVENRTSGATSTLAIRHPEFLDGRADLTVGVFACDPRGNDHKSVRFREFTATVWGAPPAR